MPPPHTVKFYRDFPEDLELLLSPEDDGVEYFGADLSD